MYMVDFIYYFAAVFTVIYLLLAVSRWWNGRLCFGDEIQKCFISPLWVYRVIYSGIFLSVVYAYLAALSYLITKLPLQGLRLIASAMVFMFLICPIVNKLARRTGIFFAALREKAVKRRVVWRADFAGVYNMGDHRLEGAIKKLNQEHKLIWLIVSPYYETKANVLWCKVTIFCS